jgi:signal peptidase I
MKPSKKPQPTTSPKESQKPPRGPDSTRETIESIVVAFILAFLFRTFEAEAFVIPTGSMAPTLYGQQRDVYCTQCGTRFAVGVSSTGSPDAEVRDGELVHAYRTHFAVCPNANCRFPNDVLEHEMFAGDRILVNKFPYEFGDPERWDVVVFKFPESAKTNYIKRLAGLPGEWLIIERGDVKVCPFSAGRDGTYHIARKKPEKQRALQLLVHHNDHPARELVDAGWPESWDNEGPSAWRADPKARTFQIESNANDSVAWHWLRYTHYAPTGSDWTKARNREDLTGRAKPQYVTDFYGYNAGIIVMDAGDKARNGARSDELPDPNFHGRGGDDEWVGDLTLNFSVDVLALEGELRVELVEGLRRYQCHVDLKTGLGGFSYIHEQDRRDENPQPQPAGDSFETGMNKVGHHDVSFCNVDDRLCLWINNRLVKFLEFDEDSKYKPQNPLPEPTEQDKAPVGIAARGAMVRLSHLHIERDIYYRDPDRGRVGPDNPYVLNDDDDDSRDEFLMLGDNSPRSNDSRGWHTTSTVPRRLLIGKAFYVYWPHGVPFLNGGRGFPLGKYCEPPPRGEGDPYPPLPKYGSFPFYPQVGRMHRIR